MDNRETIQVSATIDKNLHQMVKDEASKDNRSFSEMVGILLTLSIKERERNRAKKRKRTQGNH